MLLGVLASLGLAADIAVVPLMDVFSKDDWGAVWVYACAGVIVAQGGAMTIWLAWGAERFWVRLLFHWLLAAAGLAAWLLGVRAAEGLGDFVEALRIVGPALPLVSLAAQTPLWIVRQGLGWRLVRLGAESAASDAPDDPLSIRDLLVATLLAGISLAAARGVDGGNSHGPNFWLGWGVAVAVSAGLSLVALLPAGGWLLGLRLFAWSSAVTALYAVLAVAAMWIVFLFIVTRPGLGAWQLTGLSIVVFVFTATLTLAALAARSLGYRLIYGRRPRGGEALP